MRNVAILRGFAGRPTDLRDRVRLCRPLVSLGADRTNILVARELDWQVGTRTLKPVAEEEVARIGTLLDEDPVEVSSGSDVAVMGSEIVKAVRDAGLDDGSSLDFRLVDGGDYRIAISRPEQFEPFVEELVSGAQAVFDDEIAKSGRRHLSVAGLGALCVLRRVPLGRDIDIVIRRLTGAQVGKDDPEAYTRLLAYFAHDLDQPEDALDRQVQTYMDRQVWRTRRVTLVPKDSVYTKFVVRESLVLGDVVEPHTYKLPERIGVPNEPIHSWKPPKPHDLWISSHGT